MSIRYYLAPIIGDGQSRATAFKADVPHGRWASAGNLLNPDGTLRRNWTLVKVSLPDNAAHTAYVAANPQLIDLPDRTERVGALRLTRILNRIGITLDGINFNTRGDVLVDRIGKAVNPAFDDTKLRFGGQA